MDEYLDSSHATLVSWNGERKTPCLAAVVRYVEILDLGPARGKQGTTQKLQDSLNSIFLFSRFYATVLVWYICSSSPRAATIDRGIRDTSRQISFEFLFIKTCPPDKLHNGFVNSHILPK